MPGIGASCYGLPMAALHAVAYDANLYQVETIYILWFDRICMLYVLLNCCAFPEQPLPYLTHV